MTSPIVTMPADAPRPDHDGYHWWPAQDDKKMRPGRIARFGTAGPAEFLQAHAAASGCALVDLAQLPAATASTSHDPWTPGVIVRTGGTEDGDHAEFRSVENLREAEYLIATGVAAYNALIATEIANNMGDSK